MGRSVKDKFNLPCGQFFMSEKLLPLQQVPIAGAPRRLGPDLVPPFGAAIRDVVPGLGCYPICGPDLVPGLVGLVPGPGGSGSELALRSILHVGEASYSTGAWYQLQKLVPDLVPSLAQKGTTSSNQS